MQVFTAPMKIPKLDWDLIPIFLGGSIEQGSATDWQTEMIHALADQPAAIFNPRRKTWDSTWVQDESNFEFAEQINWELDCIKQAQIMFLYFQAGTLSPISLLELGQASARHELLPNDNSSTIVVCEPGFWRRGNVQIVCTRASIPVYSSLEEGIAAVKEEIRYWSPEWC